MELGHIIWPESPEEYKQGDMFASSIKKDPKPEMESLKSQTRLLFRENALLREDLYRLQYEMKELREFVGELYMKKTP